jgi:hypothetical protein
LRRKDIKKLGDWSWFDDPFTGTKELGGLRVMMCLINNWDLKTDNNSIYKVDGERRYAVTDLGASFGKTGNYFSRSKGVLADYSRARFIEHATSGRVDFFMHSRPFFLMVFNVPRYRERARMEKVGEDIPTADAKWLGLRLSRLSTAQLRECFRAAGYDPQTADGYAKVVHERIAVLNQL